jgi:hypothetical protein
MDLSVRLLIGFVIGSEAKVAVPAMAHAAGPCRCIYMLVHYSLKPAIQFMKVPGTTHLSSSLVQALAMRKIRKVDFELLGMTLDAMNVSKSDGVLHFSLHGRA